MRSHAVGTGVKGQVRIIGGSYRRRLLAFPARPGLRPTPDRVRETLFNWLGQLLDGFACLDLFAGSGALGLEALSRGASSASFVDSSGVAIDQLRETAARFNLQGASYIRADALEFLRAPRGPYDIVFLDPPFDSGLLGPAAQRLAAAGVLAPGAFIYVEFRALQGPPALPESWLPHRAGRAGEVGYHLLRSSL
jgi:16S rRNA (guanine966-N2)-methyltransferase